MQLPLYGRYRCHSRRWTAGPSGIVAVPVTGPLLTGTLRTDPTAKVIYLGVPDINLTPREIVAHGGKLSLCVSK